MRNVSDKICRENQNTHFMFNFCFCVENNAVYELMWKNIVDPASHTLQYNVAQKECDLPAGN